MEVVGVVAQSVERQEVLQIARLPTPLLGLPSMSNAMVVSSGVVTLRRAVQRSSRMTLRTDMMKWGSERSVVMCQGVGVKDSKVSDDKIE
jgi:hypothetical protein